MIGGAGVRGYEAADYLRKVSACEGQKLGVAHNKLSDGHYFHMASGNLN